MYIPFRVFPINRKLNNFDNKSSYLLTIIPSNFYAFRRFLQLSLQTEVFNKDVNVSINFLRDTIFHLQKEDFYSDFYWIHLIV